MRGDDTGQDGDNGPVGDDPISLGLVPIPLFGISYDGQPTTHRSKSFTIAWTDLNEDPDDDEIRAVVTLTPQLPVATSRESGPLAVVVTCSVTPSGRDRHASETVPPRRLVSRRSLPSAARSGGSTRRRTPSAACG